MRITIVALGSRGDVQPFVPLGRGLQAAGHHVRVATFEDFGELIRSAGLEFSPVRGDAQALLGAASQNGDLTRHQNPLLAFRALQRSYGTLAKNLADDLTGALRGSDLLLNQLPGNLFGPELAEFLHIPLAIVSVIPLAATGNRPLFGFPALPWKVKAYNRLTYALGNQVAWQMFRTVLNHWRVSTLGLPLRSFWGTFPQRPDPNWTILNGFSSKVVPRPADWGTHIHTTGWWLPDQTDWQPPAALLRFLEEGPAPVFIGFGSMPVADPRGTTAVIMEAVRQAGVRAILHAGWTGLGSGSSHGHPPEIFSIQYAPYTWLFPRMRAILHHGGSGTTGQALHSGVPSGIIPFIFDQFYWGERSAALGVGPPPLPFRRLTSERLSALLVEISTNPAYRLPAQTLGAALRSEDGVTAAVQIIERL